MRLVLIVAFSQNRVIGNGGSIPWRLPSDQQRFKELTMGHTVIMGRKTYESLPDSVRPLPGRTNVVVSREPAFASGDDCLVADSIERAMALADSDPAYVIGGEQIYHLTLPLADQVLATRIETRVEGDCHFPPLGEEWVCISNDALRAENGFTFRYLTYDRRA